MLFKRKTSFLLIHFAFIMVFVLPCCKGQMSMQQKQEPAPVPVYAEAPAKPVTPGHENSNSSTAKPAARISIALMLPFYLEENFPPDTVIAEDEIDRNALPALSFYEGALLAADSLKKSGINCSLPVFDVSSDSLAKPFMLLHYDALKETHAVISNFNSSQNAPASLLARQMGLHFVMLQSSTPAVIEANEHAALASPATFTQCRLMARFLSSEYRASRFTVFTRNQKRENELADVFKTQLEKMNLAVKLAEDPDTTLSAIERQPPGAPPQVIILPSSDESFVISILNALDNRNEKMIIAGLPTWEAFENVRLGKFNNLEVIIFSSSWFDMENPAVKAIRKKFIETYKTDLNFQALQGFELTLLLGETIASGNDDFMNQLPLASLSTQLFRFSKQEDGGYENLNLPILKYNGYRLLKINR